MSIDGITGELRRMARELADGSCEDDLLGVADRIDREHAELLALYHRAAVDRVRGLMHLSVDRIAIKVARPFDGGPGDRWIRLPIGADGEPIRMGDTVRCGDGKPGSSPRVWGACLCVVSRHLRRGIDRKSVV